MSLNQPSLPPSKVAANIKRCFNAGLTPIVTSPPAIGKSDILQEIADTHRMLLIDIRVPQADVTDFNGLPMRTLDGRKAQFLPFDIFPLEGDELPDHPDGGKYNGWIIFLDELTSAPKYLQVPAYKLILNRMIGTKKLHERVFLAAAGNRQQDGAVVHDMSTALQSRMVHLSMHLDHNEWIEWAIKHKVDSRILAFIEFRPELLHKFDPQHNDATFAAPRTWWFTHKLINGQKVTMDDHPLIAGTISPGVSLEFIQFCEVYSQMPKMADILKIPDKLHVPEEPSARYALATMLAERMDKTNVKPLATYLGRLPAECRALALRMLRNRTPALMREEPIVDLLAVIGDRLK